MLRHLVRAFTGTAALALLLVLGSVDLVTHHAIGVPVISAIMPTAPQPAAPAAVAQWGGTIVTISAAADDSDVGTATGIQTIACSADVLYDTGPDVTRALAIMAATGSGVSPGIAAVAFVQRPAMSWASGAALVPKGLVSTRSGLDFESAAAASPV